MPPRLILASASPRRRDLLSEQGVAFEVCSSDVDERTTETNPVKVVNQLALSKAQAVAARIDQTNGHFLVLAADTIVVADSEILGKPLNHEDAFAMLSKLSGRQHQVLTGVCLYDSASQKTTSIYRESQVYFRHLDPAEIHAYIATGEPDDKAGAYAVQGIAACFVEKIEGCVTNIIGLPVPDTVSLLRQHGVSILGLPAQSDEA